MQVSDKEEELWYGDKKVAEAMEKAQLVKKFNCKLKFLDMQFSHSMQGHGFRYKTLVK